MNEVSIIGRFVRPIVIKELSEERCVMNNIVAVSRRKKGEGQQNADFIPVVIWGSAARIVEKYCEKGNMVGLTGKLASRQYLSADGKTTFVVELVVHDVYLVEGKRFVEE